MQFGSEESQFVFFREGEHKVLYSRIEYSNDQVDLGIEQIKVTSSLTNRNLPYQLIDGF